MRTTGFEHRPIGTKVIVTTDNDTKLLTKTLSKPWVASGTTIVKVDGITGGYDIERIRLVTKNNVQTQEEILAAGEKRFGPNKELWRWICPNCDREQSVRSIRFQMEVLKQPSQRFGFLKKDQDILPEALCYQPDCNWAANGLFSGPITVVLKSPYYYEPAKKENCTMVFEFGDLVRYDCAHCGFEQNEHGNCEGCGRFVRKIPYGKV